MATNYSQFNGVKVKVSVISPEYIDHFPEQLNEGILYISEEFNLTAHKCCCGCGEDVYNKLNPVKWQLTKSIKGEISLYPSIGNWNYKCESHYWIRNNRVIDAGRMSTKTIKAIQQQDKEDRNRYHAELNNRSKSKSINSFCQFVDSRYKIVIKKLRRFRNDDK